MSKRYTPFNIDKSSGNEERLFLLNEISSNFSSFFSVGST